MKSSKTKNTYVLIILESSKLDQNVLNIMKNSRFST